MNKKMRELRANATALLAEIKALDSEADAAAIASKLDEIDELDKAYELEKRAHEAEKRFAEEHMDEPPAAGEGSAGKKASGFAIMAKMLRGGALSEDELKAVTPEDASFKALISGTDAANGENYLIPEDVRTKINELRRTYISAKDLATVIPTKSLTGSFIFENGSPAGLVAFDDGDDISSTGGEPDFKAKAFNIGFRGKIIPVSNILSGAEQAGLTAYLNTWFVRNAIITENAEIFASLKSGKTVKALSGWAALKSSINKDLDPSCKLGGVIVTNQSGFDFLDSQVDANGRPILQPNPANSTDKVFQDMPVKVFPDVQLPDVNSKHPVFYGRTADGCWFVEFMALLFASSAHAGFGRNQTHMRVIEGFDVMSADKDAYMYGLLSVPPTAPSDPPSNPPPES